MLHHEWMRRIRQQEVSETAEQQFQEIAMLESANQEARRIRRLGEIEDRLSDGLVRELIATRAPSSPS
ncbi:hypothetical protein RGR602_CH02289 [Rhizobium gallicum bv. gallicum R602sp]|uniref:Uncharacterized protein n=1 Tax=Rhizobium gallicum bv. gallicum R602sp TaxID=1041138 RepID=A0A0B4X4G7_9HYPH|nr:hypothetical protein RGR602_CH02289 [Rhizobium gallicum bv. gallicum R602sp]